MSERAAFPETFAGSSGTIPRVELGTYPTPLEELTHLPRGARSLWVKRDDLTGTGAYGGNKVRQLEYILAEALCRGGRVSSR